MTHYGFDVDGSWKEYEMIQNARQANSFLIISESETKKSNGSYMNLAYEYIIREKELGKYYFFGRYKLIEIISDLICEEIGFKSYKWEYKNIKIKFSDSNGQIFCPKIFFGYRIVGISEAIKYLFEVSRYKTYENYLLEKRNKELEQKVELLENKIKTLEIKRNN